MISWSNIRAIAGAEARLTRRLARFWIFQVIAALLGLVAYGYYAFLHHFFSAMSGTVALITPRFLVAYLGVYYLIVFVFGLIFIGFEVRARDRKQRIWEVLDALPYSNLELLAGKYLGILFVSWIPALVSVMLIVAIGMITGETVQPLSVPVFVGMMAIPAFTVAIGTIFFLTLLLKNRLLAAIAAIVLLGAALVIDFAVLPMYWAPLLDFTGGFSVPWPTDLTPRIWNFEALLQRGAYLLIGFAMIGAAAAVHPRKDDIPRARIWASSLVLFIVAGGMLLVVCRQGQQYLSVRESWRAHHGALSDESTPDIIAIRGDVDIRPGKRVTLDLDDGTLQLEPRDRNRGARAGRSCDRPPPRGRPDRDRPAEPGQR